MTIKNVETAVEAERIADLLNASVTNGALNAALKENAPDNGLDNALVPETVDSSTDVVQVPVVPIEVKSTLILSLEVADVQECGDCGGSAAHCRSAGC